MKTTIKYKIIANVSGNVSGNKRKGGPLKQGGKRPVRTNPSLRSEIAALWQRVDPLTTIPGLDAKTHVELLYLKHALKSRMALGESNKARLLKTASSKVSSSDLDCLAKNPTLYHVCVILGATIAWSPLCEISLSEDGESCTFLLDDDEYISLPLPGKDSTIDEGCDLLSSLADRARNLLEELSIDTVGSGVVNLGSLETLSDRVLESFMRRLADRLILDYIMLRVGEVMWLYENRTGQKLEGKLGNASQLQDRLRNALRDNESMALRIASSPVCEVTLREGLLQLRLDNAFILLTPTNSLYLTLLPCSSLSAYYGSSSCRLSFRSPHSMAQRLLESGYRLPLHLSPLQRDIALLSTAMNGDSEFLFGLLSRYLFSKSIMGQALCKATCFGHLKTIGIIIKYWDKLPDDGISRALVIANEKKFSDISRNIAFMRLVHNFLHSINQCSAFFEQHAQQKSAQKSKSTLLNLGIETLESFKNKFPKKLSLYHLYLVSDQEIRYKLIYLLFEPRFNDGSNTRRSLFDYCGQCPLLYNWLKQFRDAI